MSTVFKKIACFQEKIVRLMNFASGSIDQVFQNQDISVSLGQSYRDQSTF